MIPQRKRLILWQDAFDLFKTDRVDLCSQTIQSYYYTLKRLFADDPDLLGCGRLHLLTFLQKYGSSSSYNTNLFAFKCFFAWAADFYNIPDPADGLHCKKDTALPDRRVITAAEYRAIVNLTGKYRDWAVFLANTGLRCQEFCDLRPEHIKPDHLAVFGKGSKPRFVPLNKTARALLRHPHINVLKNQKYVQKHNLKYGFNKLAALASIPVFGPHALRHYFATELIDRGANIAQVSLILGHADIKTTISMYYHPTRLDGVVGLLDEE